MDAHDSRPRWLWLTVIALVFSLMHVLIDFSIGLWGKSGGNLSTVQALNIALIALTYGYWGLALVWAARDERRGLVNLFTLTLLWSFLANGVLGVLVAPPPSTAFPYQDAAHFGNMIFGGLALWTLWRPMRAGSKPSDWRHALIPLALLVANYAVESILFFVK